MIEDKKILIIGATNSGKKSILQHLNQEDIKFLSYTYEKIVINNQIDYLLRLSGNSQLSFIKDVLDENIEGIIVTINNKRGLTDTDQGIICKIREKNIPYIIFANKQDLKSGSLDIDSDTMVIPTIATKGIGINDGLILLLELIKKNAQFKAELIENYEKTHLRKTRTPELCELVLYFHSWEFENVKKSLEEKGFSNITCTEVEFQARDNRHEIYREQKHHFELQNKIEMMMIIKKEDIKYVKDAIENIKTKDIDNYMIISPIKNVLRIRTQEEGEEAID